MKVGFIGAGRMGSPMVQRLTAAGHAVTVLARTPEKAASSKNDLGATPMRTVAEVARDAKVVILCVHNDDQVRQICFDQDLAGSMEPGSSLVVHTTGNPALALELQARVPSGVTVVDAPVSGGPEDIAAGVITLYAGGDHAAIEGVREVLSQYGDPIVNTGGLGSGQAVKLVNNAVFLANIEILSAGIDFGKNLGLEESIVVECLQNGSARSFALDGVAATKSVDQFNNAVAEFLAKDLAVVRTVAESHDIDLGVIARTLGIA